MISASLNNSLLNMLTADINNSVQNITAKENNGFKPFTVDADVSAANQNTSNFSSASINNYAVSYLEPHSLFSIQKFVSENSDSEQLKQQRERGKNILNDNQTEEAENAQDEVPIQESNFIEELYGVVSQVDIATANKIYSQGLKSSETNQGYRWGYNNENGNIKQASDAYNYVFNINKEPTVLIDFMHKFNKSFDYTI